MNKLLIGTLSLLLYHSCKAQVSLPPPSIAVELITDNGIRYEFPDNIQQVINQSIGKEEKNLHFIELKTINDTTYTLTVNSLNNEKDGIMARNKIFKKTGRYYQYKSVRIPIIFYTDYRFSTPGFALTGGGYWVKFKIINDKGIILQEEEGGE